MLACRRRSPARCQAAGAPRQGVAGRYRKGPIAPMVVPARLCHSTWIGARRRPRRGQNRPTRRGGLSRRQIGRIHGRRGRCRAPAAWLRCKAPRALRAAPRRPLLRSRPARAAWTARFSGSARYLRLYSLWWRDCPRRGRRASSTIWSRRISWRQQGSWSIRGTLAARWCRGRLRLPLVGTSTRCRRRACAADGPFSGTGRSITWRRCRAPGTAVDAPAHARAV